MNITEIKNTQTGNINYQRFVPDSLEHLKTLDVVQNNSSQIIDKNDVKVPSNWKNDILLQGLDMLENKIQVHNSSNAYVLDRPENAPIETFEEAIKELKLLDTELFARDAIKAQANISPEVLFELLTEIA